TLGRSSSTSGSSDSTTTSYSITGARHYGPSAVSTLMALTPAELAAGAFGTSYALPTAKSGPTLQSVLASMSPETRRYTKRITGLTFAQLAAGAAGSP